MSKTSDMRLRLTAVAAAGLLCLTAAVAGAAPAAPADGHVRRPPLSPLAARALGPAGEMRGMAINDVGFNNRDITATTLDFPRMAAEGITSVSVYVYLYLASPTGTVVSTGPYTPTDQELQLVASAAKANGLDVHLTPVLLDATDDWRGRYVPSDLDAFFSSYTAQLVKYADLAQQLGVTLFYVGSENEQIAGRTAQWRAAIRAVRTHFHGALGYMSTPYTATNVKFWDALDIAGISAYFAMGRENNPTYGRFLAAWREVHTPFVLDLAKKIRTPLVYAEVGYHAQQGAFANPAEPAPSGTLPAPAAQADGYAALLDVLKANPLVYGVTWWRWAPGANAADGSYSPNGKPAECVLASRWSRDPQVRAAATSAPTCDLHALDAALATVSGILPG